MKRKLSFLLALCICIGALCGLAAADVANADDENGTVRPFPDVPSAASYAEAVNTLREYGIISGDDKGNFNPDSSVTRAEVAVIICRLLGMAEEAKQTSTDAFTDVPSGHWANGYVAKAAEQGIISGYGDGKFGPGDPVTYAQMIKMLVCAWKYGEEAQAAGGWPDGYIETAQNAGICRNVNITNASIEIARCNVAVLCYNTLSVAPGDFLD